MAISHHTPTQVIPAIRYCQIKMDNLSRNSKDLKKSMDEVALLVKNQSKQIFIINKAISEYSKCNIKFRILDT